MNQIKILDIGRPNPNPKNIQGVAMVNNYRVVFNFQEQGNLSLKVNYINFPQYADWDKITPSCKGGEGHQYYCGVNIIKYIQNNNIKY
jgi:hypothetical protein